MRKRPPFILLTAVFVAVVTAVGLVVLNAVAGRLEGADSLESIQRIYTHDEWNIFRLKPNTSVDLPLGVYGPFTDRWRVSGAAYHVEINDEGFRCPSVPVERTRGVFRIAFLGDSSTFGWDVDYPETFIARIADRFAEEGNPVEVLNAGVPGYSTHQGRMYLRERVIRYLPDLLVVSFARNDEIDVTFNPGREARTRSDSELMPHDQGPDAFQQFMQSEPPDLLTRVRSTNLYRYLRRLVVREAERDSGGQEGDRPIAVKRRVPPEEYRRNLQAVIQIARDAGSRVLFLNVGSTTREYPEILHEVAQAYEIPVIDAWEVFARRMGEMRTSPRYESYRTRYAGLLGREVFEDPNNEWLIYSTDFAHPNAIGHAVIADMLIERIGPIAAVERRGE